MVHRSVSFLKMYDYMNRIHPSEDHPPLTLECFMILLARISISDWAISLDDYTPFMI